MPSAPLSPAAPAAAAAAAAICHQDAYTADQQIEKSNLVDFAFRIVCYTPFLALNILLNTSIKYPKTTLCVLFNVLTSAENMAPVYDSASFDNYTTADICHFHRTQVVLLIIFIKANHQRERCKMSGN